jgi:hypothetical protein
MVERAARSHENRYDIFVTFSLHKLPHFFFSAMRIRRAASTAVKALPRLRVVYVILAISLVAAGAGYLSLIYRLDRYSFGGSLSFAKPDRRVTLATSIAAEATSLEGLSTYGTHIQEPFCISWQFNVDSWWGDHPDWQLCLQNATHQCFEPISDNGRASFLKRLHGIQHSGNCQHEAFYKKISGSGWGLDIAHVIDGLQYAMQHNVRVHILAPLNWQYAVGKPPQLQKPSCPSADMNCYFLPLSSCEPDKHMVSWTLQQGSVTFLFPWRGFSEPASNEWLLQYATRPQTWLRKRAFDIAESTGLLATQAPCTAIHVRRNDVVRHGKFSRRYHRVSEYMSAAQKRNILATNILLLTDDANAVIEATRTYPQYDWFYMERPRHEGNQGGWEHHVPSNDPALEVAVLLASFQLIQHCDVLVHSKSNLADYFYAVMRLADSSRSQATVQRLDIDRERDHSIIHNERNVLSAKLSHSFW